MQLGDGQPFYKVWAIGLGGQLTATYNDDIERGPTENQRVFRLVEPHLALRAITLHACSVYAKPLTAAQMLRRFESLGQQCQGQR